MLEICNCEFSEYDDSDDESFHFKRTCEHCNHTWYSLHCRHDGIQNPCPNCGVKPNPVKETPVHIGSEVKIVQSERFMRY